MKDQASGTSLPRYPWQIDVVGLMVFAVITGGVHFLAVRPLLDRRAEAASRAAQLCESRERVATLNGSSRQLRAQLATVQAALTNGEVKLKPASGVNQRLAELTALAAECGLEVLYVRTGTLESGRRYSQLEIELSGSGSYRTCATLLHRLRRDYRDTAVKSFDMHTSSEDGPAPVMSLALQLTWYVQP
jgi:Tfp pilus assembly protein PilO